MSTLQLNNWLFQFGVITNPDKRDWIKIFPWWEKVKVVSFWHSEFLGCYLHLYFHFYVRMRPDEHKKKKSAQYKKKHAISDKHGEKTKKSSSETLKKTYDDNSVSFPSNLEDLYIHHGLLPTQGLAPSKKNIYRLLGSYSFCSGSTSLCSRKKIILVPGITQKLLNGTHACIYLSILTVNLPQRKSLECFYAWVD